MIKSKLINNLKVEAIRHSNNTQELPILGKDMFENLYSNIFICARKKSGKSNLIYNIIKKCANKRTKILIFSPTFHKDAIYNEKLTELMDNKRIDYEICHDIINENGDNLLEEFIECEENKQGEMSDEDNEVKPVGPLVFENNENQIKNKRKPKIKILSPETIIIIDDCSHSLKDAVVSKLLKINRHLKTKVIISSQNLTDMYLQSIRQLDYLIVFKGLKTNTQKLKQIYDNTDLTPSFDEFKNIYEYATEGNYNFLYIDVANSSFRKNFNESISFAPEGFEIN
jgi:hypothetical protein